MPISRQTLHDTWPTHIIWIHFTSSIFSTSAAAQ